MNSLNQIDEQCIPLQTKVFSRWILSQIDGVSKTKIEDITKDLSNGEILCNLAKNLTNNRSQKTNNSVQSCELALDMFQKDGVNIVVTSEKSINFNDEKFILDLIWTLILHYSIEKSILCDESIIESKNNDDSNKDQVILDDVSINESAMKQNQILLSWATSKVTNYNNIEGLHPYELMLCAILDQYFPEKINYSNLNPQNSTQNFNLATTVMNELGIPVYVYSEDLKINNDKIDDKILLTQLSALKYFLDNYKKTEKKDIKINDSEYESFVFTTSQPSITISDSFASSSSMYSYDDSQLFSNVVQNKAEDSLLISNNNNNNNKGEENVTNADYSDYSDTIDSNKNESNVEIINPIVEQKNSNVEDENKKLSFIISSQENIAVNEEKDVEKEEPKEIEELNNINQNENNDNKESIKNDKTKMNAEDKLLINNISFPRFGVNVSKNIREIFQKISIKSLSHKPFNASQSHGHEFKIGKLN